MSDVLQISRRPKATPLAVPEKVTLPHTERLPTRYYGRLALEETVRAFAAVATVETRVVEGALEVTFTHVDEEAGDVIAEFLNHVLYHSATAAEEVAR